MTMDKEKKIEEIRGALKKIDRGDFSEIAGAHGKAGEWLRFLLDELIKTRNSWLSPDTSQRLIEDLIDKVERINKMTEERDKLIEVLRWYGDRETYDGNVEWDDDGNIICAEWPPINVDNGQRARDILKEIGVTVDA
jgi:hypothetical protein